MKKQLFLLKFSCFRQTNKTLIKLIERNKSTLFNINNEIGRI